MSIGLWVVGSRPHAATAALRFSDDQPSTSATAAFLLARLAFLTGASALAAGIDAAAAGPASASRMDARLRSSVALPMPLTWVRSSALLNGASFLYVLCYVTSEH